MPVQQTSTHDVIIAGAGPVGLFLACELRLAGCSVLMLERAASPTSPLKALPLGLRGLTLPTMDALDRRGLLVPHAGGEAFWTSWLVGCDGGRSTVRKVAKIGFAGTEPELTGYSLQL
jgi:2-polyprenyl-6-methoxyphenol hydroxylase-like FAD-dependent oxidoreductase